MCNYKAGREGQEVRGRAEVGARYTRRAGQARQEEGAGGRGEGGSGGVGGRVARIQGVQAATYPLFPHATRSRQVHGWPTTATTTPATLCPSRGPGKHGSQVQRRKRG